MATKSNRRGPKRKHSIPINVVQPSRSGKRLRIAHIRATVADKSSPIAVDDAIDDWSDSGDLLETDEDISSASHQFQAPSYTERKQKAAEKWEEIREKTLNVMIEDQSPPQDTIMCFVCGEVESVVRCSDCGPVHYYCEPCAIKLHSEALYHHCPEIWKDGWYVPMSLPTPILSELGHVCDDDSTTVVTRVVTCFCIQGVPRRISFPSCSCDSDAIKLIKFRYWPATPSKPTVAFSFHLLDWLEVLLLECQVAVQDMTQAISFIIESKLGQMPCHLYPVLIDSFEEYRHMKRNLNTLKTPSISTPIDSSCPACPKGSGTLTVSVDALFGLCRKRSAGNSVRGPLSKDSVFENQDDVDLFINSYQEKESSGSHECNNFLAGHALRSSTRFKALDETGVMGTVCRHEVPLRFLNLRHGERIGYAVFMLHQLKHGYPSHNIQLLYDIACTLDKHIKANKIDDLDCFDLAVPIFHSYGHKLQCQIEYGPRNKKGFGLSDGEGMERMWAYLRRFSRMTKEMRPSHRIDVLSHAILYYAEKSISNMGKILVNRMKHTLKVKDSSLSNLNQMIEASPEPFTLEEVKLWLADENQQLTNSSHDLQEESPPTWREKYISIIDSYIKLGEKIQSCEDSELCTTLLDKLQRMEIRLSDLERKHRICSRWLPGCTEYQTTKAAMDSKQQHVLLTKIKDLARERWFLLSLKAKYADGLSIATRLSRRITLVSSQIKCAISTYNEVSGEQVLSWQVATQLHMQVPEASSELLHCRTNVPAEVQHQAVAQLRQLCRSSEEIDRLKDDMANCITHYENQISLYEAEQKTLLSSSYHSRFQLGLVCLVKKHIFRCKKSLSVLKHVFSCYLPQTASTTNSGSISEQDESISFTHNAASGLHCMQERCTVAVTTTDSTPVVNTAAASTIPSPTQAVDSHRPPTDHGHTIASSPTSPDSPHSEHCMDQCFDSSATVSSVHQCTSESARSPVQEKCNVVHSYTSIREPETGVINSVPEISDSESEDDDYDIPVQTWRKERFLREEYMQTIRAQETVSLSEGDRVFLDSMIDQASSSTNKQPSGSYLNKSRAFLEKMLSLAKADAARSREHEFLSRGPFFRSMK